MAAEQIAPADLAELKRVRPLVKEHCAICFQPRACRVQYLGRPMIGKVCTNKKCLLENAERKAAELLAMQEQLVQVRAEGAAQGVRALAQAAASRKLRAASTGPVRRRAGASAAQTLRDNVRAGGGFWRDVADEEEEEAVEEVPQAVRPPRGEPKRHPSRSAFIDDAAAASDDDGAEGDDDGNATPASMRDFVVEDHCSESEQSESDAQLDPAPASIVRSGRHSRSSAASAASLAALLTPTAGGRAGGPRVLRSGTSPRPSVDSAYGRRTKRTRTAPQGADDAAAVPPSPPPAPRAPPPERVAEFEDAGGGGPKYKVQEVLWMCTEDMLTEPEEVLVVKVHDDAPPFAVLSMQYTVRRRLGEEVRVAEELLSRTSPIARAPTAAQPAAQLEPKLWPLSLTMTPMSGERGVELADEVRMWCAQQFVLRAQVVMDKQHVAGRLVEGHWGVERGDERDNPHGQGANLANLAVIGQKQAESDVKAWYRTLVDALKKEVIKEFEAHALEDPEKFANRKVTLRLSVNLNKNYAYVQGYTGKWWQNDEYRESRTGIDDERWQYCVDKYNAGANDEQNFRAVVKKPYNPRVGSGKLNQINKTNFIGSVVDFLIVSGLLKYFPTLVVAVAWMLQSGRFILSPVFVQARRGACVQMHLCVHACIALLHVHAYMHLGAQG